MKISRPEKSPAGKSKFQQLRQKVHKLSKSMEDNEILLAACFSVVLGTIILYFVNQSTDFFERCRDYL